MLNTWPNRLLDEVSGLIAKSADVELIESFDRLSALAEEHLCDLSWKEETDEILDRLGSTSAVGEITREFEQIRRIFELQHLHVIAVREAPDAIRRRRVLSTFPRSWVQEYVREGYQLSDPLFIDPHSHEPALLHDLAAMSPVVADFLRRASLHGIGPAGLVQWIEVSPGTVFAVMMTSSQTAKMFRKTAERIGYDLSAVARELALAFARANGVPRLDPNGLLDDDLILLRQVASGRRPKSRATSDRADRLCRRLGVRTLAQAAIVVAASGILSYAPLELSDFHLASPSRRSRASNRNRELPDDYVEPRWPENFRSPSNVFEVRPCQHGWAVFRNDRRFSDVVTSEGQAEKMCTEAAWGGLFPGRSGPSPHPFTAGVDQHHRQKGPPAAI